MSNLLEQASLVLIPSGYKEDIVYSEIPIDGNGDLSFTRASNGTRINSAGLVEVCPWNLVEQSNAFSTAPWSRLGTTLTSGQTDPNGNSNAWKVEFAVGGSYLYQPSILVTGVVTISAYLRADSTTTIGFNDGSAYPNSVTIGTTWQRYEFSFNVTGSNTAIQFDNYFGVSPANLAKTFYIFGAQVNIGSTAKPYFPTTDRLNVPRLTYQNGGGGCPSLLLEKQSTNLITYSEQFDQWSSSNVSATANQTTSPDGTQNADLITATSGSIHDVFNTFNGGTTNTVSIFVKKGTSQYIYISTSYQATTGDSSTILVDLDNKTLINSSSGNVAFVSGSIVEMGNGWLRVIYTTTAASATGMFIFAGISSTYTFNLSLYGRQVSSTTQTAYFYGAQVEASSYPTSYIPTTSSSATRVADACFKTGISSLIGQTEGVIYIDVLASAQNVPGLTYGFFYLFGDATNNIQLYYISGILYIYVVASSSVVINASTSQTITANTRYKMAMAYKSGQYALYVNGTQILVNTSSAVPAMSQFNFNATGFGALAAETLNNYNEFVLFPTRLTNAELASLTTL